MIPSQHWARQLTIDDSDIDDLTNYLLETETPMSTQSLLHRVVERHLLDVAQAQRERYQGVHIYDPAAEYSIGEKLIFPALHFITGEVAATRPSHTEDETPFTVIQVQMDETDTTREFAAGYALPHRLNPQADAPVILPGQDEMSADVIVAELGETMGELLEEQLRANKELVSLAGRWFPVSLMLDVNVGHLNLAEAILDMNAGGPLGTMQILDDIGGLSNAPKELQVFSMNYALNEDRRFDEVGPVDEVLWFLQRQEPPEVLTTPFQLRYMPLEYDPALLSAEMRALEAEIDDEWSSLPEIRESLEEVEITLNYPHRRAGTLPLNAKMRSIFPTARKTERIFVTLVDGQDGEEYPGWVVRKDRYVFGMNRLYRKYRLPVGAAVLISAHEDPSRIIVDFRAQRQRTEYVRLVVAKDGQMSLEEEKRAINADYDALMILGADDIASVDALHQINGGSKRSLNATLKHTMNELSRLVPQGNVHAKTLYSMINVVRRCPPGPIFAALATNPDFMTVGSNYWKLSEE